MPFLFGSTLTLATSLFFFYIFSLFSKLLLAVRFRLRFSVCATVSVR